MASRAVTVAASGAPQVVNVTTDPLEEAGGIGRERGKAFLPPNPPVPESDDPRK